MERVLSMLPTMTVFANTPGQTYFVGVTSQATIDTSAVLSTQGSPISIHVRTPAARAATSSTTMLSAALRTYVGDAKPENAATITDLSVAVKNWRADTTYTSVPYGGGNEAFLYLVLAMDGLLLPALLVSRDFDPYGDLPDPRISGPTPAAPTAIAVPDTWYVNPDLKLAWYSAPLNQTQVRAGQGVPVPLGFRHASPSDAKTLAVKTANLLVTTGVGLVQTAVSGSDQAQVICSNPAATPYGITVTVIMCAALVVVIVLAVLYARPPGKGK